MQPACSPACRASTPVCRASTPGCRASTPCTRRRRRECARVFQWRRLHLKRNAGCMQGVDAKKIRRELNLQPACRLHACCCNLQPPAYDRMQAACRLHAACMQPACISSVALALLILTHELMTGEALLICFLLHGRITPTEIQPSNIPDSGSPRFIWIPPVFAAEMKSTQQFMTHW